MGYFGNYLVLLLKLFEIVQQYSLYSVYAINGKKSNLLSLESTIVIDYCKKPGIYNLYRLYKTLGFRILSNSPHHESK